MTAEKGRTTETRRTPQRHGMQHDAGRCRCHRDEMPPTPCSTRLEAQYRHCCCHRHRHRHRLLSQDRAGQEETIRTVPQHVKLHWMLLAAFTSRTEDEQTSTPARLFAASTGFFISKVETQSTLYSLPQHRPSYRSLGSINAGWATESKVSSALHSKLPRTLDRARFLTCRRPRNESVVVVELTA